ncbi:hypothetical protein HanLR1_Chr13g0482511 [Helianthus annuus]|nr:hypothetical protein HanLR1_Chr13g0482511 [Helianthus annuus]
MVFFWCSSLVEDDDLWFVMVYGSSEIIGYDVSLDLAWCNDNAHRRCFVVSDLLLVFVMFVCWVNEDELSLIRHH